MNVNRLVSKRVAKEFGPFAIFLGLGFIGKCFLFLFLLISVLSIAPFFFGGYTTLYNLKEFICESRFWGIKQASYSISSVYNSTPQFIITARICYILVIIMIILSIIFFVVALITKNNKFVFPLLLTSVILCISLIVIAVIANNIPNEPPNKENIVNALSICPVGVYVYSQVFIANKIKPIIFTAIK